MSRLNAVTLRLPDCQVTRVERHGEGLELTVSTRERAGVCPDCGQRSGQVHSYYHRRVEDLPISGTAVVLNVRVRRLRCRNAACRRQTFAYGAWAFLARYARRTLRLVCIQQAVGFATNGECGSRLLARLGMPTSADTLLRLQRRAALSMPPTPRVLAVDDWALRRGTRYGTIFVDLERRRVVDLLPGREAQVLDTWLKAHPGVEVISRDRAPEYRSGATAGAAQAVQVADRWHLLQNLKQMLKRQFTGLGDCPALSRCPEGCARQDRPEPHRGQAFARSHPEIARSAASRARRLTLYRQIRALHLEQGLGLLTIARRLGLNRKTVRRYAYAEHFPERKSRPVPASRIDPYLPHLRARLAQGVTNASQLFREIRAQGYPGAPAAVGHWLRQRRAVPAPTTARAKRAGVMAKAERHRRHARAPRTPAPATLAWLAIKDPKQICACERPVIDWLKSTAPRRRLYRLAQMFVAMIRTRRSRLLDTWLKRAEAQSIMALRTFAKGLRDDYAAVRAALELPWSNGQAEGQVNRLKLIKRMTYGRANFDLLRARVLHAI